MEITLTPQGPYDFTLALQYLRRSDLEIMDVVEGGNYRRLFALDGKLYLVEVRPAGTVEAPALTVTVLNRPVDAGTLARLAARIGRMFSAAVEVEAFYRRVADDAVMSGIIRRFRGLKPVLASTVYESLIWAITGQQVNLRFAYTLKKWLIERYGAALPFAGRTYYDFPGPEQLAELSYADLTGMKFTGKKAEYIIDFSRRVCSGEFDLPALSACDPEEAIRRLSAVRGIGRWTAEYCLMRGLGCPDSLPAADIGLRNAVTRYYGWPEQATEAQVRALGENWSGFRSYAAFYLWFALTRDKQAAG